SHSGVRATNRRTTPTTMAPIASTTTSTGAAASARVVGARDGRRVVSFTGPTVVGTNRVPGTPADHGQTPPGPLSRLRQPSPDHPATLGSAPMSNPEPTSESGSGVDPRPST